MNKKRDYTKIKGYENLTPSDARHRYLHDLLRQYMGLTVEEVNQFIPCKRIEQTEICTKCVFTILLGGNPTAPCCWKAEADPDYAIECLEKLLGVTPEEVVDPQHNWNARAVEQVREILDFYPHDGQLLIAQEECAELIQAISKWKRASAMGDAETLRRALANLIEEIADVRIMCAQLVEIFGIGTPVTNMIDMKLERTLERIEKERQDARKKRS